MKMSADSDQKRTESLYLEISRNNDQKRCAYKSNKMQPQNHSVTFIHKN